MLWATHLPVCYGPSRRERPDCRRRHLSGRLVLSFLLADIVHMNQSHVDETGKVVPLQPRGRARRRISVATILALSFGALVLVSVGSVLALTVGANYRNTFDLVGKRANLLVGAMEDSLRAKMGRAQDAVTGIAKLYEAGGFEIDDQGAMTAALSGALSSVPDASGMLIIDRETSRRGVFRKSGQDGDQAAPFEVLKKEAVSNPVLLRRLNQLPRTRGVQWGDFVLNEGRLYANVAAPLVRQGV